jgi:hypothetical protein
MSRRPGQALGLLAAAVVALAPGRPLAQPAPSALVERARRAMVELDFDRAIELLERAESSGDNGREQLIVIYRSLAESRAALGQADAADLEFRRLLSLDPTAELPRGSSPKLTAPYRSAREFMVQKRPLVIRCDAGRGGLDLAVLSDPVALIVAGRATRRSGRTVQGASRASGRSRIALPVPADAPSDLACSALDRHGNELARAPVGASSDSDAPGAVGSDEDPTSILPPGEESRRAGGGEATPADGSPEGAPSDEGRRAPPDRDEPEEPGPAIYARWWPWALGAATAAGVGTYFAIEVQNDEDEWRVIKRNSDQYTYEEALVVQHRGERHARSSNIAFGAAAALSAVSAVLLVRQVMLSGRRNEAETASAGVGIGPLAAGGASATIWFLF